MMSTRVPATRAAGVLPICAFILSLAPRLVCGTSLQSQEPATATNATTATTATGEVTPQPAADESVRRRTPVQNGAQPPRPHPNGQPHPQPQHSAAPAATKTAPDETAATTPPVALPAPAPVPVPLPQPSPNHGEAENVRSPHDVAYEPLPWWLLPLLLDAALFAVLAAGLAAFLFVRKPPSPPVVSDGPMKQAFGAIENVAVSVQAIRAQLDIVIAQAPESLAAAIALVRDERVAASREIAELHADVTQLSSRIAQLASPSTAGQPFDSVALEHQVLGEYWKQFRAKKELSATFDAASQDISWDPLLADLGKLIPDDLKTTFDAVTAPCREHRTLISRINMVPRVLSGEIPRLKSDAEDVRRTRDFATVLMTAQSGGDAGNSLQFRFHNWIHDSFLAFADTFLQRYQQAQLEGRAGDVEAGALLVRQLLRLGGIEPIDIAPGQTVFDAARHVGRSTSNDPRFADGVITGVVRNGFVDGTQKVIRQPEVIVNRMR